MALKQKAKFSDQEVLAAVLSLVDPLGFTEMILGEKLRREITASVAVGIPKEFGDRVVIGHEQRMMIVDGWAWCFYRWRDTSVALGSKKVAARTSRKIAKTTFLIEAKISWLSVTHPWGMIADAMFHTPGEKQMKPVEARIERTINETPILRMMFGSANKGDNIWSWLTGLSWHHRIEGQNIRDAGAGQVGIAAVNMIGDEGGFGRTAPYNQRLGVPLPDAFEVWTGVPRPAETGPFRRLVDFQWKLMEQGKETEWSVHGNPPLDSPLYKTRKARYHLSANPRFHADKAWSDLIADKAWDDETVMTQYLGLDVSGGSSAFPNIMTAPIPFYHHYVTTNGIKGGEIDSMIDSLGVPETGMATWGIFCDYGWSPSPLELTLAYKDENIWYVYARFSGQRLSTYDAALLINAVDRNIPGLASMVVVDVHGQGRGVGDDLRELPQFHGYSYDARLYSADFETWMDDPRVLVHGKCKTEVRPDPEDRDYFFCETCDIYVGSDEIAAIRVQAKELLTGDLVNAFDVSTRMLAGTPIASDYQSWGLVLPSTDIEAIDELRDTVAISSGKSVRFIGPGESRRERDHITDTLRCIATGERRGPPRDIPSSAGEGEMTIEDFSEEMARSQRGDHGWSRTPQHLLPPEFSTLDSYFS